MPAFQFRFAPFFARAAYVPRKPRHPLARIALGLLGLGVLLVLVFFSVFVGLGMLAIGLCWRLWKQRNKPLVRGRATRTLDGEFSLVRKAPLPS